MLSDSEFLLRRSVVPAPPPRPSALGVRESTQQLSSEGELVSCALTLNFFFRETGWVRDAGGLA